MFADLLHVFIQALSFLLVIGLGLAGLLLIPWRAEELAATESAMRTSLRIARRVPEAWLRQASAAHLSRAQGTLEPMAARSTQP